MPEYIYTKTEKQGHIQGFIQAIDAIISHPAAKEHYPSFAEFYQELKTKASVLMQQGFVQDDCTEIARLFQPFLDTYRDWEPPFNRDQNGKLEIPNWYTEVEKLHAHLVRVTEKLQSIGHY